MFYKNTYDFISMLFMVYIMKNMQRDKYLC